MTTNTPAEKSPAGRKNILMIIDSLGIGGAERSVQLLSSEMVSKGHRVVVLTIRDEIKLELDDKVVVDTLGLVKVKPLPSYLINALRLKARLSMLQSKYGDFDLAVSNLTLSNRLSSMARIQRIYYCIHENLTISNLSKRRGLSRIFRKLRIKNMLSGKEIISVSEGIRDDLINSFNISPALIRTIHNPIDVRVIRDQSREPNPYHGQKYIVHVGRMSDEKRHDVLLEAYRQSGIPHQLVLVGDGPRRPAIVNKIRELGLEDKVKLAGMLKNPYPVMKDAELLVLSSDYEGFGIVLTEALALRTMVVSTDCESGPREIMSPGFTDYLAPLGDAQGLANKIRQALADLEGGRIDIDDTVVERFAVARISQEYLSLCQ